MAEQFSNAPAPSREEFDDLAEQIVPLATYGKHFYFPNGVNSFEVPDIPTSYYTLLCLLHMSGNGDGVFAISANGSTPTITHIAGYNMASRITVSQSGNKLTITAESTY